MTDAHRLDRMRNVAQRVNNLPTLPSVMSRVIEMVDNPRTTAPQLARFIANDPALTGKILKLANSAFYGFPQKIGTINLAIVVLGFQSVKDLGLSAAVVEVFKDSVCEDIVDLNQFWTHAVAVAAGCKIITRERRLKIAGETFVAGLLHDVGKLVMCNQMTDDYRLILEKSRNEGSLTWENEIEQTGFSHADLGGWLIERWSLPSHQASAVYDHHQPWNSTKEPNVAMVIHFADNLANRAGYGINNYTDTMKIEPQVHAYLHLKEDEDGNIDWEHYQDRLSEEIDQAKAFLNVLEDVT